ncbi:MAG: pseudouridine synthase, partial [Nitriliruptorales bacterium]
MMNRRFVAGPGEEGERLDVVLAAWLGESRSQAAARIDRGEVTIGHGPAKRSVRVESGDEVEVAPPPEAPSGAAGVAPPPIRYEDDHLLVVAKPAGLVVHPGVGHPAGTLVQAIEEAGYELAPAGGEERPGVVHRLDRGTSGLLVVAKTDVAHAGLVRLLRRRRVERGYVALAEGGFDATRGLVDVPIGRDPRDRKRFAAAADG